MISTRPGPGEGIKLPSDDNPDVGPDNSDRQGPSCGNRGRRLVTTNCGCLTNEESTLPSALYLKSVNISRWRCFRQTTILRRPERKRRTQKNSYCGKPRAPPPPPSLPVPCKNQNQRLFRYCRITTRERGKARLHRCCSGTRAKTLQSAQPTATIFPSGMQGIALAWECHSTTDKGRSRRCQTVRGARLPSGVLFIPGKQKKPLR